MRHRLLLRGFTNHMKARKKQTEHYIEHLRSQYKDRLKYWDIRAQSRLRAGHMIALIADGMDQAKFAYPRSPCMDSKQWANFARPRAHIVGIKVHGYGMFMAVSRGDCPKDSSHHCELMCKVLTMVQRRFNLNLSMCHILLQSDNCVREMKNNTLARWASGMVCKGRFSALNSFGMPCFSSTVDVFQHCASRQECWPRALCPTSERGIVTKTLIRHLAALRVSCTNNHWLIPHKTSSPSSRSGWMNLSFPLSPTGKRSRSTA